MTQDHTFKIELFYVKCPNCERIIEARHEEIECPYCHHQFIKKSQKGESQPEMEF